MTPVQTSKMIGHSYQVVKDGLGLIRESAGVWTHVEAFDREVNVGIILLLSGNLRIHVAKHA